MDTADAALEAGRLLFARPATFELSVTRLEDLPAPTLPEFAFAGRSNVGKSSLLNALLSRKALVRASSEPGRTRALNFFRLDDRLRLVDLPGYGYASAPKDEIARWTALMGDYLRGRTALARVFVLVDARHGLKPNDSEILGALDQAAVSYQVVLTKTDKLARGEIEGRLAAAGAAIARRPAAHPAILATSAVDALGLETLRAEIAALA